MIAFLLILPVFRDCYGYFVAMVNMVVDITNTFLAKVKRID